MTLQLFAYQHSVYSWIARLALCEKGVSFELVEVNPFEEKPSESYLKLHPFNRVPTLVHDGFSLYETGAITRYIDEQFAGPLLQPVDPRLRAIQNQLISIADSYAYWPLVRQVFSHGFFRPKLGLDTDEAEIIAGLAAAEKVLAAIEEIASGKACLIGDDLSLADIHLYPMIAYFASADEGLEMLEGYSKLLNWSKKMGVRQSTIETTPGIIL